MSDRYYLACQKIGDDGELKWGVLRRFKGEDKARDAFKAQPCGEAHDVRAKALLRVGDDGRTHVVELEGVHTGVDSWSRSADDSVVERRALSGRPEEV